MTTDLPAPPDRAAVRRQARAARAAFVRALAPAVRRGLEQALADRLLPHLGPAGVLGSYAAIGPELDPAPIEAAARAAGWAIAFPRVTVGGPLAFHACRFTDLVPGFCGIPEPPADAPAATPTRLLVPLLAADGAGNRLGQGGGHYDRTLAALRAAGPVVAIGLGFDQQLVPHIAAEPWDQPLDALATPSAFRRFATGAKGRA